MFYRSFQHVSQISCAICAVFLNVILVYLIIFKSPKSIGFYKYLMIYISVFEAVYSILDVSIEPIIHSHGSAFIAFTRTRNSMFGEDLSFLILIIYCGCFGFSLALFAVHFVYRFGVIETTFHEKYLEGSKIISLFLIPLVCGFWWSYLCSLFAANPEMDKYMRRSLMDNYNVSMEDVTYVCFRFFNLDKNGKSEPSHLPFLAILCMFIMIMSSMFCVFYFGIKCYRIIHSAILKNPVKSRVTQSLQKQLFYALVIQTCIPLVLMYIPAGVLFLTAIFEIQIGLASSVVTMTIAFYPAVDPLPNMIIIKDYRRAIKRFIIRCLIRIIPHTETTDGNASEASIRRTTL